MLPVLYLTHRVPYPPDKGDRIRNYHLLRVLSQSARVWLASLADEPLSESARQTLPSLCERFAVVPLPRWRRWLRASWGFLHGRSLSEGVFWEPQLRRLLLEWARQTRFHSAVASASSVAHYLRDLLPQTPAVIDIMDVDSQKWQDYAQRATGWRRWLYRQESERVRRLEQDLPRWAKSVSLVSQPEAQLYESIAGPGTALPATNGVDLDYFHPLDQPEEPICVFVGALDYPPNVDAVEWFIAEVWPAIRQRHTASEFHIVGRNPPTSLKRLANVPGVRCVGPVEDVRSHLAQAAVVVVPLRLARGVQNKVLEALAMGKATVASPAAITALKVKPGLELLAPSTVEEWQLMISELLDSPSRRRGLGRAARHYVEAHHRWEICLAPLVERILS